MPERRAGRCRPAVNPSNAPGQAGGGCRAHGGPWERTASASEQQRHLLHGVGLAAEVELGPQAAGELAEHLARSEALAERGTALRDVGQQRERSEIALDDLLDPRPLDLDDDRLAGTQPRAIRLTDRRGRERLPVELGEHLCRRGHRTPPPAPDDVSTGSGATRFCNFESSSQTSVGIRSTRVAAICPSLT